MGDGLDYRERYRNLRDIGTLAHAASTGTGVDWASIGVACENG